MDCNEKQLGDSGMRDSPKEETWPRVLAQQLNLNCLFRFFFFICFCILLLLHPTAAIGEGLLFDASPP